MSSKKSVASNLRSTFTRALSRQKPDVYNSSASPCSTLLEFAPVADADDDATLYESAGITPAMPRQELGRSKAKYTDQMLDPEDRTWDAPRKTPSSPSRSMRPFHSRKNGTTKSQDAASKYFLDWAEMMDPEDSAWTM